MARRIETKPLALAWLDDLPVRERTLDNGLRALVLPLRRAPIVVCDLYYPVGSFDEPPGQTGSGPLCRAHALQGDGAISQGSDRPARAARRGAIQRRDFRRQYPLLVRVSQGALGAGAGDRGRPDARGPVRSRSRSRSSGA